MSWGKLEKLKIKSFPTPERLEGTFTLASSTRVKKVETYEVMFNPESYSFKYENELQKAKGIGSAGRTARYSLTKSSKLSFKFLIDDSSASSGMFSGESSNYDSSSLLARASSISVGQFSPRKTIHDRVEAFLDLTGRIDGKIHEPRYLRLEWGDLRFDCRLESVEVSYTLFNRNGKPIRAELNATFVEDVAPKKLAAVTDRQSPDLTHKRQIVSGDTLPLMSYDIYRDPSQYIRVAQFNNINNFRKLKPDTALKFPPIKDTNNL